MRGLWDDEKIISESNESAIVCSGYWHTLVSAETGERYYLGHCDCGKILDTTRGKS